MNRTDSEKHMAGLLADAAVRGIIVLLVLLLFLQPGLRGAEAPGVPPVKGGRIAMLCLGAHVSTAKPDGGTLFSRRQSLPDERLQAKLDAAGIVWACEPFSTQITWEFLKQFNVVLCLDFPIPEKLPAETAAVYAVEELLARFVREGGGLLLTGTTEAGMWALERNTEELNRFLKPFGAQVASEQVDEKDITKTLPTFGASRLAWANKVTPHPLTEGVKGLLYPLDFSWAYWTHPVQVGEGWQVLVSAAETAASYRVKLGSGATAAGNADANRQPGTFKSAPPLVAVADRGKGRIALWPTTPSATFVDSYHVFWGNGLMMDGTGSLPSDGWKLLNNLITWLAAPSAGQFGGYVRDEYKTGIDEVGFAAVNWDKVTVDGKSQPNVYKGLIGLKSRLSSGTAEPAEMIVAARAAGYQYAAFLEDLERLTPEALTSLKKLCAEQSGPQFQVFPGFAFHDGSGNAWGVFGPQIFWPKDDWWLDREKKNVVNCNVIFRGFQSAPVVLLQAGKNPEPAWFQGNFKGMAVVTYDAGKLLDDATDIYLKLQGEGFSLHPCVAHLVRSPEEVRAAAALPYQSYTRWWELEDVLGPYSGNYSMYKGNYVFHRPQFISSGPVIEDFRVYNFGTADLAVPGNDRYRIHMQLTAPRGLREVVLRDGLQLFRRFVLNGETEWTLDVDGYQDRDRHFVLIATDREGGRIISADRWTDVQELALIRCTDNINTYVTGKHLGFNLHPLRALESYLDRQAGAFGYFPGLHEPEVERPAVDQRLPMVGRYGYVKEDVLDYYYPPSASANWNHNDQAELAAPGKLWKGMTRTTLFTPRPDSTFVYLVEGDYDVLRDYTLSKDKGVTVYAGNWLDDADTYYVARKNGLPGSVKKLLRRDPYLTGSFADVEYVANVAPFGGSRAIIPLSPDLAFSGTAGTPGGKCHLGASLNVGTALTRGQRLTYRYLAAWSRINGPSDASFAEEICEKMGLRGKTAYQVTPTHGRVADSAFFLTLEASGQGFAGRISETKLPLDLPVWVNGLNDNWAAGVLYKGRSTVMLPVWKMDKVGNRYVEYRAFPGEDQLFRFPVANGRGMLQVNLDVGAKDLFIGNLLVCDQPELILALDEARPGKARISVNNPTDRELTCTVRPGPGFTLLGDFAKTLTLPPGGAASFAPAAAAAKP